MKTNLTIKVSIDGNLIYNCDTTETILQEIYFKDGDYLLEDFTHKTTSLLTSVKKLIKKYEYIRMLTVDLLSGEYNNYQVVKSYRIIKRFSTDEKLKLCEFKYNKFNFDADGYEVNKYTDILPLIENLCQTAFNTYINGKNN